MKIISKEKWGIDTNIIVYSFDRKSPFFQKAKVFFQMLLKSDVDLYVAQQNIVEIEKVLLMVYKKNRKDTINLIEDFISAFDIQIINPLPKTIYLYHDLLLKHKPKDIFDLFLGATYLDNNINRLFSVNIKDLLNIPNLITVNPFTII